MSCGGASRSASADRDGEGAVTDQQTDAVTSDRPSVSQLVRNYSDPPGESQKRDRSESGDSAPAGKRGARERSGEPGRSPSALSSRSVNDRLDAAIDGLESRVMLALSRELHEFRESIGAEISRLNVRVKDLEQHVEERDCFIADLSDELRHAKTEVSALQHRVEEAEVHSRQPCLILSGAAMASRHAPRLEPPMPGRTAPAAAAAVPAGRGQGQIVTSRSADRRAGAEREPGQSAPGADGAGRAAQGRSPARDRGWEDREDINALVVNTLTRCMPNLNFTVNDIDRAHRLPGPNNRVIVRFMRSGEGSVRDEVMSRRLELRGKDLFVNESLTKLRGQIFRSLLAAKRQKKIYTVYSRGGNVFFKEKQHGVGTRVDSLQRLRELGYSVLER